jgi:hypothetical protein
VTPSRSITTKRSPCLSFGGDLFLDWTTYGESVYTPLHDNMLTKNSASENQQ